MATEKRLIDANVTINVFTKWLTSTYDGRMPKDVVAEIPTVDAVEVVHGRWINPYINRYGHPCHCCSECGFKASYQDKNYCPNCGAKMDGERRTDG